MRKNIPIFTVEETEKVVKKLNPAFSKACNDNFLWGNAPHGTYSGDYYGFSLKRSCLDGAKFCESNFDHCNFTGSILKRVIFDSNCKFSSVNFLRSILSDCTFKSNETMHALNFSSCTLENVCFENVILRGSYFNSAKIINCSFNDSKIMSTSFDNCIIANSSFSNCNMRNLNLEFSTFLNVNLENSQISFYQLPYIIGIFKNPENLKTVKIGCNKNKTINFNEYVEKIQDSIIFFTSKNQFLPLANLYYLKGQKEIAKNCIFVGIDKAIINNDYTLIKYLIKLALILELLDYSEVNKILSDIDIHLNKIKDDVNYSFYLLQSFEIQNEIQNVFEKSILNFKIDTIFTNEQFSEASELCQEIDNIITATNINITHSFKLSHNSPIAIALTVIGATADLITISSLIYKFIEKKLKKNKSVSDEVKKAFERHNKLFLSNVDERINNLKTIISKTSKNAQEQVIEDFRVKLLASIGEFIDINFSLITTQ